MASWKFKIWKQISNIQWGEKLRSAKAPLQQQHSAPRTIGFCLHSSILHILHIHSKTYHTKKYFITNCAHTPKRHDWYLLWLQPSMRKCMQGLFYGCKCQKIKKIPPQIIMNHSFTWTLQGVADCNFRGESLLLNMVNFYFRSNFKCVVRPYIYLGSPCLCFVLATLTS